MCDDGTGGGAGTLEAGVLGVAFVDSFCIVVQRFRFQFARAQLFLFM